MRPRGFSLHDRTGVFYALEKTANFDCSIILQISSEELSIADCPGTEMKKSLVNGSAERKHVHQVDHVATSIICN